MTPADAPPLTLASKSAARTQLLTGAGVRFQTAGSGVDEDVIKTERLAAGDGPDAIAAELARAKALAVSRTRPGLVIGADQTLDLDGVLYDKAPNLPEAEARLRLLRGKSHQLHSAVAVAESGEIVWEELVSATLVMRDFSDAFLDAYLQAEGEALLGSVGCYRLEGPGAQLFSAIEGDYFSILGLPIMGLFPYLRGRGVLVE